MRFLTFCLNLLYVSSWVWLSRYLEVNPSYSYQGSSYLCSMGWPQSFIQCDDFLKILAIFSKKWWISRTNFENTYKILISWLHRVPFYSKSQKVLLDFWKVSWILLLGTFTFVADVTDFLAEEFLEILNPNPAPLALEIESVRLEDRSFLQLDFTGDTCSTYFGSEVIIKF